MYADWLTEHGDPLGEFIRIQCRRASLSFDQLEHWELRQQEQALLAEHRFTWAEELTELVDHFQFYRGFPSRIRVYSDKFLRNADRILGLTPVEDAFFDIPTSPTALPATRSADHEKLSLILSSEKLNTIDSLVFSYTPLERVLESEHISHIRKLVIKGGVTTEGLVSASQCSALENMESLTLAGFKCQWWRLFVNPHLKNLKCLRIGGEHSKDPGEKLYESPLWAQLNSVGFNFSGLNKKNVNSFLATAPWSHLKSLSLRGNRSSVYLQEMFAEKRMENLKSLSVFRGFAPARAKQIIQDLLLPNLRVLAFNSTQAIDEETLARLRGSYIGANLYALYDGTGTCPAPLSQLKNLKYLQFPPYLVNAKKKIDEEYGTTFSRSQEVDFLISPVEDWSSIFA